MRDIHLINVQLLNIVQLINVGHLRGIIFVHIISSTIYLSLREEPWGNGHFSLQTPSARALHARLDCS